MDKYPINRKMQIVCHFNLGFLNHDEPVNFNLFDPDNDKIYDNIPAVKIGYGFYSYDFTPVKQGTYKYVFTLSGATPALGTFIVE